MQGVVLRPMFKRGSHVFVFPMVLAPYQDASWRVVLGAGVLPPLAGLLLKYYVVRPLRRRYKLRKVRSMCARETHLVLVHHNAPLFERLCGDAALESQGASAGDGSGHPGIGTRGNCIMMCMCC